MAVLLSIPSGFTIAQTLPEVVSDETSTETGTIQMPGTEELNTIDADEDAEQGDAQAEADQADGGVVISAPSAFAPQEEEDIFFDADNLVPQGEMAKEGPNKVNPSTQPASKLIIVKKDYTPDTKAAQVVSAERALSLGLYDSALGMFDTLYAKNKRDSRVLMGRAVTLQKLGRFDEAMQMYEKLSTLEPRNIEVKVNMLGLLSTRYPSVALRRLLDLHAENSSNIGLTAQIGFAYARAGDAQSALKYMGMASSMEPHNAGHLFNMAVIADRAGAKKQAIGYYEKALETDSVHGAGRSIPRDSVFERLAQLR